MCAATTRARGHAGLPLLDLHPPPVRVTDDERQAPFAVADFAGVVRGGLEPRASGRQIGDGEAEAHAIGRVGGVRRVKLDHATVVLIREMNRAVAVGVLVEAQPEQLVEGARAADVGAAEDQEVETVHRPSAAPLLRVANRFTSSTNIRIPTASAASVKS